MQPQQIPTFRRNKHICKHSLPQVQCPVMLQAMPYGSETPHHNHMNFSKQLGQIAIYLTALTSNNENTA